MSTPSLTEPSLTGKHLVALPGSDVFEGRLPTTGTALDVACGAGAVPGFDAGFVGVDVFFALSGFLIVRGLLDEIDQAGRIDLVRFWTARARRLLPAATVTIAVTLLASMLVLSPFSWEARLREAWAATFYWANLHFAGESQSYFATGAEESPFLHFWSLSIEEQTYLVLPLLMTAAVMSSHRRKRSAVARLLWIVVGLSLLLSVVTVHSGRTPGTYFSSVTPGMGAGGRWIAGLACHDDRLGGAEGHAERHPPRSGSRSSRPPYWLSTPPGCTRASRRSFPSSARCS